MSTRSLIFMKEHNEYKGIYCHYDGYMDGVGQELLKSYSKKRTVKKLIKLGSISYLSHKIPKKRTLKQAVFDSFFKDYTLPYSVRGERIETINLKNLEEIKTYAKSIGAEYVYIFIDGKWMWLGDKALFLLDSIKDYDF